MRDKTGEVGRGQFMEALGAMSRSWYLFLECKRKCLGCFCSRGKMIPFIT